MKRFARGRVGDKKSRARIREEHQEEKKSKLRMEKAMANERESADLLAEMKEGNKIISRVADSMESIANLAADTKRKGDLVSQIDIGIKLGDLDEAKELKAALRNYAHRHLRLLLAPNSQSKVTRHRKG